MVAEINCCDIAPGDELIATGSQDKTAKLWSKDLRLVGALRGHKRGIWCCQFSPADRYRTNLFVFFISTGTGIRSLRIRNMTFCQPIAHKKSACCCRTYCGFESVGIDLLAVSGSRSQNFLLRLWIGPGV
jgi:WD40 repeat protein